MRYEVRDAPAARAMELMRLIGKTTSDNESVNTLKHNLPQAPNRKENDHADTSQQLRRLDPET